VKKILCLVIICSIIFVIIYIGILTYMIHPILCAFYILFVLGFLFNDDPYIDMPSHV
jgi:hypothetical protein